MLKSAITYLNSILEATGYFGRNYGLVVLVNKSEGDVRTQYPAEYCGNNNYNKVTDFDQQNGSSYWRLRAEITQSFVNSPAVSRQLLQRTYPLKIVCVVKRSTLSTANDNGYSEDKLSFAIQKTLDEQGKALRQNLKADRVQFVFRGVNVNFDEISTTEFVNISMDQRSSFILMTLDVDLIVDVQNSCVDDFCDDDVDIDAYWISKVVTDITADPTLLTTEQTDSIVETFCTSSVNIDLNSIRVITNATTDQDIPVEYVNGDPVGSLVGSTWTIPNQNTAAINTANPIKTGQTVSYVAGDDGDIQQGRLSSFTTLDWTNPFGNTNRFTDITGAQTYAVGIVVDWSTANQVTEEVILYTTSNTQDNWANANTNAQATDLGGFSSGWYIPNLQMLDQLVDHSDTGNGFISPFSISIPNSSWNLWSSTTYAASTTAAKCYTNSQQSIIRGKTNNGSWIAYRNTTYAELGI